MGAEADGNRGTTQPAEKETHFEAVEDTKNRESENAPLTVVEG
jgi:hypothetical protein